MTKPIKRAAILGLSVVATMFVNIIAGVGVSFAAQPKPMEAWHQPAATEVMEFIEWFDEYTLWFLVPIVLLVLGLLVWVAIRYRASANPEPSKTTHNTMIEVIWTVGPIFVLIMFAIPSFDLLDRQLAPKAEPEMTIKATANKWYWDYEYQDGSEISFTATMLDSEKARNDTGKTDLKEYPRLLATDYDVVVPTDTMVRILVTSADVIHSFAMPSFGVKVDAIPGRSNESWFNVKKEGIYYGQCSELCDDNHAFMPIAIRAVSKDKYEKWKAAAANDIDAANKELMASLGQKETDKVAAKPAVKNAADKEGDTKLASNADSGNSKAVTGEAKQ